MAAGSFFVRHLLFDLVGFELRFALVNILNFHIAHVGTYTSEKTEGCRLEALYGLSNESVTFYKGADLEAVRGRDTDFNFRRSAAAGPAPPAVADTTHAAPYGACGFQYGEVETHNYDKVWELIGNYTAWAVVYIIISFIVLCALKVVPAP